MDHKINYTRLLQNKMQNLHEYIEIRFNNIKFLKFLYCEAHEEHILKFQSTLTQKKLSCCFSKSYTAGT